MNEEDPVPSVPLWQIFLPALWAAGLLWGWSLLLPRVAACRHPAGWGFAWGQQPLENAHFFLLVS